MAFVGAPSVAAQAFGGNGPNTGKINSTARGVIAQQPPSPSFVPAPKGSGFVVPAGSIGFPL